MKLDSVWTAVIGFFDILTFQTSKVNDRTSIQYPLDGDSKAVTIQPGHPHFRPSELDAQTLASVADDGRAYFLEDGTPLVATPKNVQDGNSRIVCQYPDMVGWTGCNSEDNRGCWLKKGNQQIGIGTNYEDEGQVPHGVVRRYYLEVGEEPISPDKVTMEHAKLFNRTYPGPWLEACWGDTLEVTVYNGLRWNGTSIHWHGFRQLGTNHEDGVNGVTECPIAPGDTYTYRFRALQYGSAWYHSHYGLQYGDGTLGPITIYGPATANFGRDDAFRPILMTDWNHRSVFEDWPSELTSGNAPQMTNILINGTGQFGPGSTTKDKYQLTFQKKQRYKLILVNTSVDTIFVFSIDHHEFEVIEMDFVPINPFTTKSIKVAIGQRYHIVVKSLEDPYELERAGNYWMRTKPASKCSKFAFGPDHLSGVIRYDPAAKPDDAPLSEPEKAVDLSCMDEDKKNLIPWLAWQVKDPANIDPKQTDVAQDKRYKFDVAMRNASGWPYEPSDERLHWEMHLAPFHINFSEPTILNFDNIYNNLTGLPHLDIVTYDGDGKDKWIWMVITASDIPVGGEGRAFFPAAHPMHLHGHDFAILYQTSYPWYDYSDPAHPGHDLPGMHTLFTPDQLNCDNDYIDCYNPTRRDVVMLPAGGFVIIAFKADNPGAWIMHCHIAFHASSGLAMQIIENKHLIPKTNAEAMPKITQRCKNWHDWFNDPNNLWNPYNVTEFQDDSGV